MTANKQQVRAEIAPSPFAVARLTREFNVGVSLSDMLADIQPDVYLRGHAHVLINGVAVPRENWARVYPKGGSLVNIRFVPSGGGGGRKNPLRTVLSLAVLAASPVLAGSLGTALGASGSFLGISASRLITTGVNLLGRLAINALAPPPRPRLSCAVKETPGYFIQGAQNRLQPFARVPKVLGKHRFVPPMGALPYTETVGSEQYLRLLFVWGYGPLNIGELKIGETPLSEFQDVEIETRQGYVDDAPLMLYSNAVLQNDLQVVLRQSGGYQLRVSEAEAEELSVDVTFPRGLFRFDNANNKQSSSVEIEVQYSPAGADDWSAPASGFKAVAAQESAVLALPEPYVSGGVSHVSIRIDRVAIDVASGMVTVISGPLHRAGIDVGVPETPALPPHLRALARITRRSNQTLAIDSADIVDERGIAFDGSLFEASGDFAVTRGVVVGTLAIAAGGLQYRPLVITARQTTTLRRVASFKVPKGQYDVRLNRLTADAVDDKIFDEVNWTALRSVRASRPVRMTGLAMTALRIRATDQLNGMIDRFNGVVQSIVPDWDGASWVEQPTSNPASLFRHVLQGAGNARPLADSRIDMAHLAEWHERCRLEGREFNSVIDGDQSVREVLHDIAAVGRASPAMIDGRWSVIEDRTQSVPVQHFTPRNTFGFQGQKSFDEEPQALRVRFINREKGWLQDERLVYADGVTAENAERYETLELSGVTDPAQVWRDGRYHMATARLRPETYRFSTDIEHIVCTRGDLVRLTHDVPLFGLQSGRVTARIESGGQLTGVVLDAQLMQQAGKSYCLRLRLENGESLLASVSTVASTSAEVIFATPLTLATNIKAGDLAMFGEAGQESVELVVRAIEPQGDLSARITCVDAAPAIHAADQGDIPAFQSHVTLPPDMQTPPTPQVAEIQSGEESLIRHTDGSMTTRIVLSLAPVAFSRPLTLQVLLRGEGEKKYRAADIVGASDTQVSIIGVEEGQRYDLQLRYLSVDGARSAVRLVNNYQVQGTLAEPSDVAGLNVAVLGDILTLSWPRVTDIDLSHYTLRYTPQEGSVNWSNAVDLVSRIAMDATSLSLPAAAGSYLIKALMWAADKAATRQW